MIRFSLTRPRARSVVALAVTTLLSNIAIAQPSFTLIPGLTNTSSPSTMRLAANGRYVTFTNLDTLYRYDRTSATLSTLSSPDINQDLLNPVVDDNGLVYGVEIVRSAPSTIIRRVFRWNPANNEFRRSDSTGTGYSSFVVNDVNPEGTALIGSRGYAVPGEGPITEGFRLSIPIGGPGPGESFATLAQAVDVKKIISRGLNTFDVFGRSRTSRNADTFASGWLLNAAYPTKKYPFSQFDDLDRDARIFLTENTLWVNGVSTSLTFPSGYTAPAAKFLSADARIVAGRATDPAGIPRTLIWRGSTAPESLVTVLSLAGVNTLGWDGRGNITGVSDDGTVIVGSLPQGIDANQLFVAVLPPKNDGCVNATPVTFGSYSDSTRNASPSLASNTCAPDTTSGDIWYAFTPAEAELVRLDTCGSDFDTTLTVYRGTSASCGTTSSPIACNDQFGCVGNANTSRVEFNAAVGFTYYIRVAGWNGASGRSQLTISAPNRPVNDSCAGALDLDAGFSRLFDTSTATTDTRPGCTDSPLPFFDLWYKTVAPDTGRMTFSTCGSAGNFVVSVYSADACGNASATPLDCSNTAGCSGFGGVISVPCTKGEVFYTRVGGAFGARGGGGRINAFFACDAVGSLLPYPASIVFAPVGQRPLGYWRFEDSGTTVAADAIRNDQFTCGNYPGIQSTYFRVPGVLGGGMAPFLLVPNTGVRNVFVPGNLNTTTIEAWFKTTEPNAGEILDARSDSSEFGLRLAIASESLVFRLEGPGNFVFGNVVRPNNLPFPFNDGSWHHLVGVRGPLGFPFSGVNAHRLYLDGELIDITAPFQAGSTTLPNASGSWSIGNRNIDPNFTTAFIGTLDEVAIYPVAQDQSTIIDRYLLLADGCRPVMLSRPPGPATLQQDTSATFAMNAVSNRPVSYQWSIEDPVTRIVTPLADGVAPNGTNVVGAQKPTINLENITYPGWNGWTLIADALTECGVNSSRVVLTIEGTCRCPADFDQSGGTPDTTDIAAFFDSWLLGEPAADADCSGGTPDTTDIAAFFAAWLAGGC
jgi:hypothetical protein